MYDSAMGLSYRPNHIKLHKYFLISKTYPEEQGKQPVMSCSDLIVHGGRRHAVPDSLLKPMLFLILQKKSILDVIQKFTLIK